MSKLEAIRNREPYTEDGVQMCFIRETGNMSVYQPCQFQQLATSGGGDFLGLIMFSVLVALVGLAWGGSYIAARQTQYDSLFAAVRRSMGQ